MKKISTSVDIEKGRCHLKNRGLEIFRGESGGLKLLGNAFNSISARWVKNVEKRPYGPLKRAFKDILVVL